uniref:Uncharacterized protein n=1 Tax=Peronospora matthiolae TaxID=2874970 RepID=A0AAV1TQX8_9STRA
MRGWKLLRVKATDGDYEIDKLMTEIEHDLEMLGATAIEDKLQNNVPRCIANLMRAGMRVWEGI